MKSHAYILEYRVVQISIYKTFHCCGVAASSVLCCSRLKSYISTYVHILTLHHTLLKVPRFFILIGQERVSWNAPWIWRMERLLRMNFCLAQIIDMSIWMWVLHVFLAHHQTWGPLLHIGHGHTTRRHAWRRVQNIASDMFRFMFNMSRLDRKTLEHVSRQ